MAGSTSTSAAPSTQPSRITNSQMSAVLIPCPTGRVVKLSIRISNTTRCAFMARNSRVTSMVRNCPMVATDTPLTGSTMDAKPMPIWMPMICPAITKA
jgi:hypothetical protein